MRITDPGNHSDRVRCFIGVPVPEQVRHDLGAQIGDWSPSGRPVPFANLHLTLAFIGDTPIEAVHRIHRAIDAEQLGSAFEIQLRGLGAFPRPERATVLWLGVERGAEAVNALNTGVMRALRSAGMPTEERPFYPHLTLSRIRPPGDVRALLEHAPLLDVRIMVDAVVLFRSYLGSGSPRYEEMERVTLPSRL